MTDINKWDHKDEWHRYGKDFLVAVKRHTVVPCAFTSHEGPNRWTVYAYKVFADADRLFEHLEKQT